MPGGFCLPYQRRLKSDPVSVWVPVQTYPIFYPGIGLAPSQGIVLHLACCWFGGHEDKIVTKKLESGYNETEVRP